MVDVRTIGFGSRVGSSIKGVLVGGLLFVVSFPVLFWNEGRAVKTAKGLEEGEKSVVVAAADKIDAANAGKLVHLGAEATTDETLADDVFPAVSARALHLTRKVEIYQWKERKEEKRTRNTGGSETVKTTYHYDKTWTDAPINSNNFHETGHPVNTGTLPCPSTEWFPQKVALGAFTLPRDLVARIGSAEALAPKQSAEAVPLKVASGPTPKAAGDGYYFGINPAAPEIGDARVTFRVVRPQVVSVLARQNGDTLAPHDTSYGTQIYRIERGAKTAQQMFAAAQAENAMRTWILRLVGFVVMFIGLALIFAPLGVMADVLPFLGGIVRLGTGIAAFAMSLALSLVTMSIAWLFYRPLIGVPLLVGAIALIVVAKMAGSKRAAPSPT
jgi:hypothetical protein